MRYTILAGLLAVVLSVGACASAIMQSYMGKPLQVVMLDYGPPTNAFDMPDGSRAFQWVITSTYTTPMTVTSTTMPIGNVWFTNTQITGGQAISGRCIYTLLARWDGMQNAWVFYDYKSPSLICE